VAHGEPAYVDVATYLALVCEGGAVIVPTFDPISGSALDVDDGVTDDLHVPRVRHPRPAGVIAGIGGIGVLAPTVVVPDLP
jgi:hypothetical protein